MLSVLFAKPSWNCLFLCVKKYGKYEKENVGGRGCFGFHWGLTIFGPQKLFYWLKKIMWIQNGFKMGLAIRVYEKKILV